MIDHDPSAELKAENARLIALLEANGIQWRAQPEHVVPPASTPEPLRLSTDEKVALFRRLFQGRTDVYPVRWESKTSAKSGYSPTCANEWRAGVCEKPRIKCGDCGSRLLIPLSDAVLYDHLTGKHTVGVYPLLEDDTCHFLVIDFDETEWRDDARVFVQSCTELGVPAALEISRSGKGAHVWVFFAGRGRHAGHRCGRLQRLLSRRAMTLNGICQRSLYRSSSSISVSPGEELFFAHLGLACVPGLACASFWR